MTHLNKIIPAVMALSLPVFAEAAGLSSLGSLRQDEFRSFARDVGSALSYKAVSPGEPLGLLGFDLGAELSATRLSHPEVFKAAGGRGEDFLALPKLHVHKGLPLALDLGAFYAKVPGFGASLYGAELRWSPFSGGALMPAVSLRGAYTVLAGSDVLGFHSESAEVVVSKGVLFLTPYGGAGLVHGSVTPRAGTLSAESVWQNKLFAGVNMNLGLVNLAVEADHTGHDFSYSAKVGFRF